MNYMYNSWAVLYIQSYSINVKVNGHHDINQIADMIQAIQLKPSFAYVHWFDTMTVS